MPNTWFDAADLIVPAYDSNAKTIKVAVELHPGQVRMLEYILGSGRFPFHDIAQVVRWAVCWAIHTLLAPLPSSFGLIEAKMNIQDENFERQQDCLSVSVQKYLEAGNTDAARRLVLQTNEDCQNITNEYWRTKWLSTIEPAFENPRRKGNRSQAPEKIAIALTANSSDFCVELTLHFSQQASSSRSRRRPLSAYLASYRHRSITQPTRIERCATS